MNIEKMREEFEAKYPIPSGVSWSDGWGYVMPESKSDLGSVWALSRHLDLWDCWQSSRAALVVNLPPSPYLPGSDPADMTSYEIGEAQGRCDMWAAFRECLEAAGLKVKP